MAPVAGSGLAVIALDTHALIWWTLSPLRLGRKASAAIRDSDRLGIPAVVFWEVALLARKSKVNLGVSVAEWASSVLTLPRIEPLPLTPAIALGAEALAMHADPADRFIVATAIEYGVELITADRQIRTSKLVPTVW